MKDKGRETKLCCDTDDLTYFVNFITDYILNSTKQDREKLVFQMRSIIFLKKLMKMINDY